jgi:hypothetical protein
MYKNDKCNVINNCNSNKLNECSICLDTINKESYIILDCKHDFHLNCIMKHIIISIQSNLIIRCPLCRTNINRDIFYNIYINFSYIRKSIKNDISKIQKKIYTLYFKFQFKRIIKKINKISAFKYITKEEELVELISNKKIILNNIDNELKCLNTCMFYM